MLLTAESIKKYIECELETLNRAISNPDVDQEVKDNAIRIEQTLFTIQAGIEHKTDESVFADWNRMFKPKNEKVKLFRQNQMVHTVDGYIVKILAVVDDYTVLIEDENSTQKVIDLDRLIVSASVL